jgi:hypothetical protein
MESAPLTRFRDLPLELRHEIWTLTLPGPRLITVNCFSKAPPALHINRESRSIALKHYELVEPQHLDEVGHTNGHRCVKGYIDFGVDIVHMTGLTPCEGIDRKICHLQGNCWLPGQISAARTFLMTDFAVMKFPRLRSYKTVLHFNPDIRGIEFYNLPRQLTEDEFQQKLDAVVENTSRRIEAIKANKELESLNWEPPAYSFVRCERDAAELKCEKPGSCEGYLHAPA